MCENSQCSVRARRNLDIAKRVRCQLRCVPKRQFRLFLFFVVSKLSHGSAGLLAPQNPHNSKSIEIAEILIAICRLAQLFWFYCFSVSKVANGHCIRQPNSR